MHDALPLESWEIERPNRSAAADWDGFFRLKTINIQRDQIDKKEDERFCPLVQIEYFIFHDDLYFS
jgi:hypothetical protein